MYRQTTYTTPCPNCQGTVKSYSFDGDCRGNPGGGATTCTDCNREFTNAEWQAIAREEIEERNFQESARWMMISLERLSETPAAESSVHQHLKEVLEEGRLPDALQDGFDVVSYFMEINDFARNAERVREYLNPKTTSR